MPPRVRALSVAIALDYADAITLHILHHTFIHTLLSI
jgi:hypothetical protein